MYIMLLFVCLLIGFAHHEVRRLPGATLRSLNLAGSSCPRVARRSRHHWLLPAALLHLLCTYETVAMSYTVCDNCSTVCHMHQLKAVLQVRRQVFWSTHSCLGAQNRCSCSIHAQNNTYPPNMTACVALSPGMLAKQWPDLGSSGLCDGCIATSCKTYPPSF